MPETISLWPAISLIQRWLRVSSLNVGRLPLHADVDRQSRNPRAFGRTNVDGYLLGSGEKRRGVHREECAKRFAEVAIGIPR
jgi:hypothetical protein